MNILTNLLHHATTAGAYLGHNVTPAVEATAAAIGDTAPEQQGFFGTATFWLMYVAAFGAMWFFIIRPNRAKQKKMQEMQNSLQIGDNIVTAAGMFGKIVDTGQDVYVVEFGTIKGIRIPVAKEQIVGLREPILTVAPSAE